MVRGSSPLPSCRTISLMLVAHYAWATSYTGIAAPVDALVGVIRCV